MDVKDLLHLTQRSIREQREEMGSSTSSHPHRKGAFFTLLPPRLEFREDRQLLSSETADPHTAISIRSSTASPTR